MDVMVSPGGFRFLPADGPFSGGVAAEPGYQVVRVRAHRYTSLADGFRTVEKVLEQAGRPLAALCAMELRIPAPLTREGFEAFNRPYIEQHKRWGLAIDAFIPTARTNVAPEFEPPKEPSLHAFCHTIEAEDARKTFVISGAAEPPGTKGGLGAYWSAIADTLDRRMQMLGLTWNDATEAQFYGTRADHEVFAAADLSRFEELIRPGLRWFFSRPPIDTLRLEIDVRGLAAESWA